MPPSPTPVRRRFLAALGAAAIPAPAAARGTITLGLGDYGLRSLKTPEAVRLIAEIGYDSIEFTLMPGWPLEPKLVPPAARRDLGKMVADAGLPVASLLEQVFITGGDAAHRASLDRLRRDAEFAHDISPAAPPVVQTHLGGSDKDWDKLKNMIVDRLGNWARVGAETKTVICIKGHNKNLMDTAEKSQWVMRQVHGPWLKLLYDYSHYEAVGQTLPHTMDLLLPFAAMISIKDARPHATGGGFDRLLPGDGKVDYIDYYRRLLKFGYSGHTVVEISGQIHSQPGYDAVATARKCYRNVAPAMEKAGVKRLRGGKS